MVTQPQRCSSVLAFFHLSSLHKRDGGSPNVCELRLQPDFTINTGLANVHVDMRYLTTLSLGISSPIFICLAQDRDHWRALVNT
jgi:hypothetical protein